MEEKITEKNSSVKTQFADTLPLKKNQKTTMIHNRDQGKESLYQKLHLNHCLCFGKLQFRTFVIL